MNDYYIYVYLDTRKKSKNIFSETISFDYEPFYVGKGRNKRYRQHLMPCGKGYNRLRDSIITKILDEGKEPIIIKVYDGLSEEDALIKEEELITLIGRRDLCLGTLSNLTDGGDGAKSRICKDETKELLRKALSGRVFTEEWKQKISDNTLKTKQDFICF